MRTAEYFAEKHLREETQLHGLAKNLDRFNLKRQSEGYEYSEEKIEDVKTDCNMTIRYVEMLREIRRRELSRFDMMISDTSKVAEVPAEASQSGGGVV